MPRVPQAVRRGGTAPGFPAFTVILHVINPQVGRSNFMTHVMRAHQASAATAAAASSVASLAPNPFRLTSAASMNLAAGSVAAHSMGGTSASGASLLDNSDAIMKSLGYTRSGGTVASQPSVTQPSAPARLMSKVEEGDEGAEQEDALDEEDEEKRAAALANDMDEDGSSTVGPLRSSVSSAASSKRDAPGLAGRSSTASRAAPVSGVAQAAQLPAREPESNRGSLEVDRASLNPHIHPAVSAAARARRCSYQAHHNSCVMHSRAVARTCLLVRRPSAASGAGSLRPRTSPTSWLKGPCRRSPRSPRDPQR